MENILEEIKEKKNPLEEKTVNVKTQCDYLKIKLKETKRID